MKQIIPLCLLFVALSFSSFGNGNNNPTNEACADVLEIEIPLDDHAEEISWTLVNLDSYTSIAAGEYFTDADDFATISTDMCLTQGCYELTIYDSWGDGICCYESDQTLKIKTKSGMTLLESDGQFTDFIVVECCVSPQGISLVNRA